MDIERLHQDHAVLLRWASRLSGLAAGLRTRGDACDVRSSIDQMDAGLSVHLTVEDTDIYPRLMQHTDPRLQALATETFADMGVMRGAWASYRDLWTVDRILADKARFATATQALMQALAMRIALENDVLYPAAQAASANRTCQTAD